MNSAPNQPNSTFNSQPASGTQSNPFTADLKGEFTSNFGTNTNAVSQIFKDGSFSGSGKSRTYIMIGVLVLCAAVGWYVLSGDEGSEETADDAATAEDAAPATKPAAAAAPVAAPVEAPVAETPAAAPAAGAITLTAPEASASLAYDETQGSAMFSWEGGPGTIVFSRHSSMQPEVMRVKVSGASYSFHHPWPGQWFWKVESDAGGSEVRSFSVSAPVRRNVALTAPAVGGTLAGTGGVVSWTGDKGVAYYRVELNQSDDWSNPQFKFSSSGSQAQLNGVAAGQYKMRLGAFSEVSGRWEYSQPTSVTVQ
ncbi:MAG: hypothetical protein WCO71_02940 [Pseudomonadota bacterium]